MTEQEIKEVDRTVISNIAKTLKEVYSFNGDKTSSVINEEINLNYNYKCFTSKILEKRIKGISYINKLIEDIEKKEFNP